MATRPTGTMLGYRGNSNSYLTLKGGAGSSNHMVVNFEESGQGKPGPFLMIHGAGGSSASWFMQLKMLSDQLQVIALDLNGHGKTPDRAEPDVTRSYLDDIHEVVRKLKHPYLCGHSMGGALIQLYALENPENVAGLVLVGTGARLKVNPMIFDLLNNNFEGYVEATGDFMFHENTADDIREASKVEVRRCPARITKRDFEVCNEFDIMEQVSDIRLPTLVVVGESDLMTPVKYANYLVDKIADSKINIIPSAGHAVMLEQAEEFNKALVEWFKSLTQG
ncbi:MAG: alpha/beta fold hydrolase [Candidatus Hermodarchaeota archaeon]